jgi:hypothetical protein
MSIPAVWPQCLDFFGMALVIEPSPGQPSTTVSPPLAQIYRAGQARELRPACDILLLSMRSSWMVLFSTNGA